MAYIAPYIDETGLHIPTYNDILEDIISNAKAIFGDDIYLENDSADYQLISVFALKMYDTLQAVQYAYDARSPVTAIGTALDTVAKLNGIKRKAAGYSTCDVKLTGTPYTQILGGVVRDKFGVLWDLPSMVIIASTGEITTTATCQIPGSNTALIGELNEIVTPTYGWLSVTNEVDAIPGNAMEPDIKLRQRQAVSVARPSQTMLEGTLASIVYCDNVSRAAVYENDTNSSSVTPDNPYGFPAHSITCVVEGGDNTDIGKAILMHKGIGCYTNGTTSVNIEGANGFINTIRFYRPTFIDVHVSITLKPYSGYVTSSCDTVKNAIFDYLNSQGIGADISLSSLLAIAMQCNDDLKNPTFGIQEIKIGKTAAWLGHDDIVIGYNEIPRGNKTYIEVV